MRTAKETSMKKTTMSCADGTWNAPGQDDGGDGMSDPTNVYKLFCGLENEQEKELNDSKKAVQVAKYIHGVGDSPNPIHRIMGGASGSGKISRIVRGYTTTDGESGLSDTALAWMVQQPTDIGGQFTSPIFPGHAPNEFGVAHKPWLKWPFSDPQRIARRSFPAGSHTPHPCVAQRRLKPVCHGPGEPPAMYSPNNGP